MTTPTPDKLREAASDVLATMSGTHKARNGRDVGIQGDDGEMCWIVHSDQIEALRSALSEQPPQPVQGAMETVDEIADGIRDHLCCPREQGCELNGAAECPAERVRAMLSTAPKPEGEDDRLSEALANFDKANAECPVNQGKVPGDRKCPRCGADSTQGCGPATLAAFATVTTLKTLAALEPAPKAESPTQFYSDEEARRQIRNLEAAGKDWMRRAQEAEAKLAAQAERSEG